MDEIDRTILIRLMNDGRATWADLAAEMDLTAPAIAQRVRRLQERGIIKQFTAWVAPSALAHVSAFVEVSLGSPEGRARFRQDVEKLASVQECHQIAGDCDYVLKVRCLTLEQLSELVTSVLPKLGAERVRASVILSTIKESPVVPVLEDGQQFDSGGQA